jgi:uncharacterized membrane protein YdbT with pleckstrin-like domain
VADKIENDVIWKDRKRILGMPLSFTRYAATEDRFILIKGFLNTETDEILLYRITDIKLKRSLGQKIFGVGTIILYSADQTNNVLEIKNITRSDEVRGFLSKLIEEQRARKGITSREFFSSHSHDPDIDLDGDGLPG